MDVTRTPIDGLICFQPTRFEDSRGFFTEIYRQSEFEIATGSKFKFVQENLSLSLQAGTIRGLHTQIQPFAQGKLVRCVRGKVFDVAVDIRQTSTTFGQWVGIELSAENGKQLWVPPGFLHGFCTLESNSEVTYKCTAYYSAEHDRAVAWNDNQIGIDWPVERPILSDKDLAAPQLGAVDFAF